MGVRLVVSAEAAQGESGVFIGDTLVPFGKLVSKVRYTGEYDRKTCPECAADIGKVYDVVSSFLSN